MPEVTQEIASKIRSLFQETHDVLVKEEQRKILVSHHGTFSQDLVGSLSNGVEELLISKGDYKVVIKRMFSILMEGLQNIRIHGEKDENNRQLAYVIIASTQDNYKIIMANMILSSERDKMRSYLDEINGLSEEALKEKYLSVLSNEFISSKGGAGLGIITTRVKSGALDYNFIPLNDEMNLFSLEITLPRLK